MRVQREMMASSAKSRIQMAKGETDLPASGEGKRPPRDKQANRRTANKRSVKQFKGKA